MATTRRFVLSEAKPSFSEFYVEIDLTDWLNGEQIAGVVFTAQDRSDGSDVTSDVLNTDNCTYTTVKVYPFIKGGETTKIYVVTMQVTSNGVPASKDEFYLEFTVNDNIEKVGL